MGTFRSFPSCLAPVLRFNAATVLTRSANARLRLATRMVAVGLMLALMLTLLAMASAPQLHLAHHPDAGHEQHHCPVTLLTQGQLESAPVPGTTATLPCSVFVLAQTFLLFFPSSSDVRLLPGRAPPALLFPA
jgi:hypothetical protein